jgi:purine-nucleoside phosphorylase
MSFESTALPPLQNRLDDTLSAIRPKMPFDQADVAIVLGSGLGSFVESISDQTGPIVKIPFADVPHFPQPTVEGHHGNLVFFEWKASGLKVVCQQGRFHYYEGHPMAQVTYPIRLFAALGVKTLMVSNAAGGINPNFSQGDLMLIRDHINFTGQNPLIGPNEAQFGPRFQDMTTAYDSSLRDAAKAIGQKNNLSLQEGVYLGLTGPTYETPAEIGIFRTFGADAVGMSTVPEVIVARHCGMKVFGVSCITNMAAGMTGQALNHEEVMDIANRVQGQFVTLFSGMLDSLSN